MDRRSGATGCDLRGQCGFYCHFVHLEAEVWQTMIRNYCEGPDFPLCARRIFFSRTGYCAPADMTPIGTLPQDLLETILRSENE